MVKPKEPQPIIKPLSSQLLICNKSSVAISPSRSVFLLSTSTNHISVSPSVARGVFWAPGTLCEEQWLCVAIINTLPRRWFIEVPPAPNYVNPIICWGGFAETACSCNTLFFWKWENVVESDFWVLSIRLPELNAAVSLACGSGRWVCIL